MTCERANIRTSMEAKSQVLRPLKSISADRAAVLRNGESSPKVVEMVFERDSSMGLRGRSQRFSGT